MKRKQKLSFSELIENERELIKQNPELMDKIEQKLEEKLSSGIMKTAD